MGALTNFDGTDQFQLRYLGNDSAPIVRGTNYTAAGIQTAIQNIAGWPAGRHRDRQRRQRHVLHGHLRRHARQHGRGRARARRTARAAPASRARSPRAARRRGTGPVTATGNSIPTVTTPASFTIPLRTPFALTGIRLPTPTATRSPTSGSRTTPAAARGTGLVDNTKLNGPLFRQFGVVANVSDEDTLQYDSPGENHATTDPTRVFPDLDQILANNTNADGPAPVRPPDPTADAGADRLLLGVPAERRRVPADRAALPRDGAGRAWRRERRAGRRSRSRRTPGRSWSPRRTTP